MFQEKIEKITQKGLYRSLFTRDHGTGPIIVTEGKECLSFSSNDYLGLSGHPSIIQAGQAALEKYGAGSGASRLLGGGTPPHRELEQEMARFKKTEAALLFGSGYLANLALITTLADRGDLILADRLNHASLMDGCRLSPAAFKVYRHGDMDHLRHLLSRKPREQKAMIVTEGVFSMDGDLAPLPRLVELSRDYGAFLMVDDAHGFGVMGEEGRGTAEYFGVEKEIDLQMGTLGKAAGVYGAFAAGSRPLIEYLINCAKPFIYTTALPPAIPSMALASLKIISGEKSLRQRLSSHQAYFSGQLRRLGFPIPKTPAPILPLVIGEVRKTVEFAKALLDRGIFIPAIRPPTVPEDTSRLRISLSASHTREHLDQCLNHLNDLGRQFGIL